MQDLVFYHFRSYRYGIHCKTEDHTRSKSSEYKKTRMTYDNYINLVNNLKNLGSSYPSDITFEIDDDEKNLI